MVQFPVNGGMTIPQDGQSRSLTPQNGFWRWESGGLSNQSGAESTSNQLGFGMAES